MSEHQDSPENPESLQPGSLQAKHHTQITGLLTITTPKPNKITKDLKHLLEHWGLTYTHVPLPTRPISLLETAELAQTNPQLSHRITGDTWTIEINP